MLRKIISGGQTGADEAGLFVGKRFGLETGGTMPLGFRTLTGPRPDFAALYGVVQHTSEAYPPRTELNARDSDATLRLACDFESPGERCTLRAVKKAGKQHFDVDLSDPPPVEDVIQWMILHGVQILNVAGNSEQTYAGCYRRSVAFLTELCFTLGLEMHIDSSEALDILRLPIACELLDEGGSVLPGFRVRKKAS